MKSKIEYYNAAIGKLIADEAKDFSDETIIEKLTPCVMGKMLIRIVFEIKERYDIDRIGYIETNN